MVLCQPAEGGVGVARGVAVQRLHQGVVAQQDGRRRAVAGERGAERIQPADQHGMVGRRLGGVGLPGFGGIGHGQVHGGGAGGVVGVGVAGGQPAQRRQRGEQAAVQDGVVGGAPDVGVLGGGRQQGGPVQGLHAGFGGHPLPAAQLGAQLSACGGGVQPALHLAIGNARGCGVQPVQQRAIGQHIVQCAPALIGRRIWGFQQPATVF